MILLQKWLAGLLLTRSQFRRLLVLDLVESGTKSKCSVGLVLVPELAVPPLRGHGNGKKNTYNNQPVSGNVWEPPRPGGGHGSGPLRPWPEFSWGGSVGLPKAAPTLSPG